jgi:putative endonuclease
MIGRKTIAETNYAKGFQAEEAAANYLIKKGFEILRHRYKTKLGEIDLIARHKNVLCFVEVKVRQSEVEALESINTKTQKRIENAALLFLAENPEYAECDMRFDVIGITKPFKIHHLDNAWEARS